MMENLTRWTFVWFTLLSLLVRAEESLNISKLKIRYENELKKCLADSCEDSADLKMTMKLLNRYEAAVEKNKILGEEKRQLMKQLSPSILVSSNIKLGNCEKAEIKKQLQTELGIIENGGLVYNRQEVGADSGAACWSNGKKKLEATVTLCEFPLSLSVRTKSGTYAAPVIQETLYLFDMRGCQLLSVAQTRDDIHSKFEMKVTRGECLEEWNSSTNIDSAISPKLQFCLTRLLNHLSKTTAFPKRQVSKPIAPEKKTTDLSPALKDKEH